MNSYSKFAMILLIALLTLVGCTCPPCPPCETPTPEPTATAVVPDKPSCWDPRLDDIGVTLERRDGNYELIAAWVIINGNWDDTEIPACVMDRWPYVSGADHNAFGRAENHDGSDWNAEKFALIWPDGGTVRTPEISGWANVPIYGGGGKYDWFVYGGDKLHDINLPGNHHWSTYAVWGERGEATDSLGMEDSLMMNDVMEVTQ